MIITINNITYQCELGEIKEGELYVFHNNSLTFTHISSMTFTNRWSYRIINKK